MKIRRLPQKFHGSVVAPMHIRPPRATICAISCIVGGNPLAKQANAKAEAGKHCKLAGLFRAVLVVAALALGPSVFMPAAAQDLESRAAEAPPAFPTPDIFAMAPMRDGAQLATSILLPEGDGPFPAILIRTSYKDGVIPWGVFGHQRYLAAGYAVVWQSTRGTGASEGEFRFVADDRSDGYDAVEWVAAQPWCDGNVGMDGGSYLGITQLQAATMAPPHLKAIIPHVPSADFWRETPYAGGIFMRYHMLNWLKLMSVDQFAELGVGFMEPVKVLADPAWVARLNSRPLIDAANGFLAGDRLAQYRAFVQQSTFGDYWRAIQNMPEHYAKMDVPVLLITGNFDPSIGALTVWKGLEAHAPKPQQRHMLIGPWTHGQSFFDGVTENGPYQFGEAALMDLFALRIAFYDRHLKGQPPGVPLPQRVRVFVTGANVWREFDGLPVPGRQEKRLYLASNGSANSSAGDGALRLDGSSGPADRAVADPENPIIAKASLMEGAGLYNEPEQREDMLVYTSAPLEEPLTIIGEPSISLHVAADAPDADVIARLTQVYPDGRSILLGTGGSLRLRYRDGYHRERKLRPGKVYKVQLPLAYVGHQVAAGHRLRLNLMGTEFPLLDPNPHTGEPIATATRLRKASLSLFHDDRRPSFIALPVIE